MRNCPRPNGRGTRDSLSRGRLERPAGLNGLAAKSEECKTSCQDSLQRSKSQDYQHEKSHGKISSFLTAQAGVRRLEGDLSKMATTDLFWKLFAQTGSISAYLAYRRTPPAASPT